jgi:hypothetical protein
VWYPWWWRQQAPLKGRWTCTRLHGTTSQKTAHLLFVFSLVLHCIYGGLVVNTAFVLTHNTHCDNNYLWSVKKWYLLIWLVKVPDTSTKYNAQFRKCSTVGQDTSEQMFIITVRTDMETINNWQKSLHILNKSFADSDRAFDKHPEPVWMHTHRKRPVPARNSSSVF